MHLTLRKAPSYDVIKNTQTTALAHALKHMLYVILATVGGREYEEVLLRSRRRVTGECLGRARTHTREFSSSF